MKQLNEKNMQFLVIFSAFEKIATKFMPTRIDFEPKMKGQFLILTTEAIAKSFEF